MSDGSSVVAADGERRSGAIDASVGYRMRFRRVLLGMSQQQLGEAVGVTAQQIETYEQGWTRVGACRLWDISRAMDVPLGFFYIDDAPRKASSEHERKPGGHFGRQTNPPDRPLQSGPGRRETLDLLEAYNHITDPVMRKNVLNLVQSMRPVRPEG